MRFLIKNKIKTQIKNDYKKLKFEIINKKHLLKGL